MQTVIIHLQRVSYFRPVIAVEAVIEIRLVRCVFEIAVDPQIHFVFRYFDPFRFKFLFNVVVIVIPNRYDIFFPVLDFYGDITVFFREGANPATSPSFISETSSFIYALHSGPKVRCVRVFLALATVPQTSPVLSLR